MEYSSAPKRYKGLRLGCITFEDELKTIGSKAIILDNNELLYRVELPFSVVSLKADSFITMELESNLYDIDGNIIIDSKLIRKKLSKGNHLEDSIILEIPEGVTCIEDFIKWEHINDVKKLILPSTLKYIGKNAFRGFDFTSLKLPKELEIIESNAFAGCGIKTLTVPDNVKIIGDFAFENCCNLKKVKIGKNVESIGKGVFSGINKLECIEGKYSSPDKNILVYDGILQSVATKSIPKEFEIPSDVRKIASYAFSRVKLDKLIIPESIEIIEENAFEKCEIKKFEGKFVENRMIIVDSILIKAEYNHSSKIEDLEIPERVTKIGGGALQWTCYRVHLPSNLKIVGQSAFFGSWDSTVNCFDIILPESVEKIERNAFSVWESYQFKDNRFIIPKNVKYIGKSALSCNGGDIWFEPIIPPVFEDKGILFITNIFVPSESIEAYKKALPKNADRIHVWEK